MQVSHTTGRRRARTGRLVLAAAALAVAGLGSTASALDYTYTGGPGAKLWTTPANWDLGFDYPGATPASDNANVQVALNGDLTLDLVNAPINIINLSLGDTAAPSTTTIAASGTGTLTAQNIASGGVAGATNVISAPFLTLPGGVNVTAGAVDNDLTFAGSLTYGDGGTVTVRNQSLADVYLNGPVYLNAAGATTGGTRRLQTENTSDSQFIVNGDITDNGGPTQLVEIQGYVTLNGTNTYAGNTRLGTGSRSAFVTISTDSAFGLGTLESRSSTNNTITAVGGTRTIANNFTISQNINFDGGESVVMSGRVVQSNSRSINNNIVAAGKTLTLSGDVFTANNDAGRNLTFGGAGTTVVSGSIQNSFGNPPGQGGAVVYTGGGTLVLTGDNTYDFETRSTGSGNVQLGNGGTTGSIVAPVVSFGDTGTGKFVINRSDDLTVDTAVNGTGGIQKLGANTVNLTSSNFQSGSNTVSGGTLLVNGTSVAASSQTGSVFNSTFGDARVQTVTGIDATGLVVGQTVNVDGGTGFGSYVFSVDGPNQVTLSGWNLAQGSQALNFNAGTGLGTGSTVVQNGATIGGGGVIGGQVLALAGASVSPGSTGAGDIGTLVVNSGVTFAGGSAATLVIDYDSTDPGFADVLDVGGLLNLNGATLDLNSISGPADDEAYVIARYGSLGGTFGTVLDLPTGYAISYNYMGNQIALIDSALVPEPATLGALAGIGLLAVGRRRRRTA